MANVNYEEVTYQKKEASNPNYNIDKDAVWEKHETAQNVALNESNALYDDRVDTIDEYYQKQIENSKAWADKQTQLQNERTDFTIEQINQQKDQAKKDYTKEQSGAYVDWQKQSNQYGVNAEKMAGSGLTNTGYSESSQVSMYNTYQNRISTAREVYNKAVLNYDNAIKDAQLQNNSALAEIAFKAQEEQLRFVVESSLQQNTLLIEKANKQQQIQEMYYSRYLNELDQLYKENALAEEIRQYNLNYNQKERENELANEHWKKEIAMEQEKLRQEKEQSDAELKHKQALLEEEQRQFDIKNPPNGGNDVIIKPDETEPETDIGATDGSNPTFDAKEYGKFANGQPKGIYGHGEVSKTEKTVVDENGKTSKETFWTAKDGTLWYWNGSRYVRITGEGEKMLQQEREDWQSSLAPNVNAGKLDPPWGKSWLTQAPLPASPSGSAQVSDEAKSVVENKPLALDKNNSPLAPPWGNSWLTRLPLSNKKR